MPLRAFVHGAPTNKSVHMGRDSSVQARLDTTKTDVQRDAVPLESTSTGNMVAIAKLLFKVPTRSGFGNGDMQAMHQH
eukprot:12377233-Alexandrium_andersonii.AAC.1